MALYMIGIGLDNENDITLRGLQAVKECKKVYFENYTSQLNCKFEALEKLYGKKLIPANRDLVEKHAEDTILKDAKEFDTAFLVVGDVFSATTHVDLKLRAHEKKIPVHVIHGASVLTAVGVTGLEVYKFGKTASIPFHNEHVVSPIKIWKQNKECKMHTIFLLDLDLKNKRLMTIGEALEYLMKNKVPKDAMCIGCAALGSEKPEIKYGKVEIIAKQKFSKFPQLVIIPSELHFMEEESLNTYKVE